MLHLTVDYIYSLLPNMEITDHNNNKEQCAIHSTNYNNGYI